MLAILEGWLKNSVGVNSVHTKTFKKFTLLQISNSERKKGGTNVPICYLPMFRILLDKSGRVLQELRLH